MDPVPTGTANLVKGWAAVLGERGLAMDRSSGVTFFMPQPGHWWCMETMSNFLHTDFTGVPFRVNQNTNAAPYAQASSLDVILHRHIDFQTWGKLFNSPGVLWLSSLRPLFLSHARPHCVYLYMCGSDDMRTVSRDVLARGRLFAGKQLAALHASSHHISRVAGGFS